MTETSAEPSSIIFKDDDKEVLNKPEREVDKENIEKKIYYFPHQHRSTQKI